MRFGNMIAAGLVLLMMSASQVDAADKPKVGVALPLSGPLAGVGSEALRQIRQNLEPAAELIIEDTQGRADLANMVYRKLVDVNEVALVMGLPTIAETNALLRRERVVPVLALAQAPSLEALRQGAGAQIYMFNQPPLQWAAIAKGLGSEKKLLVSAWPAFSPKAELLGRELGGRAELGTQLTTSNGSELSKQAVSKEAALAVIADSSLQNAIFGDARGASAKLVFISPPRSGRTATVAARVAREWLRKGDLDDAGLRAALAKSPYFDEGTRSLAVDWSVATVNTKLVASASTSGSTCSCTSKDGKVSKDVACKDPPEKCETSRQETDCTCECK